MAAIWNEKETEVVEQLLHHYSLNILNSSFSPFLLQFWYWLMSEMDWT